MYGLYVQLNDYDQPEYVAAVFKNKPSNEELLKFISSEYPFITAEKIDMLLNAKVIRDTLSNKAEPWAYTEFRLCEINFGTWL